LIAGLAKRSWEPKNAIISSVHDVEIALRIHRQTRWGGHAGGSGCAPGTLREGGSKVYLAEYKVGLLAVSKTHGAAKSKNAVIACVRDVKAGGIGSKVDCYPLGV